VNILFLDQFSDMGGAQHGLLQTVDAACRRGWLCWAVLPGSGPLTDQLRARGVSTVEIPCGPYHSGAKTAADVFRFASDLAAQTRILRNLINRIPFDLIYVNGPRLLPVVAALEHRMPALFHAHSHIPQRAAQMLAQRSIRRANASVVACSHSVLAPFRNCADATRLHVIPNGVPEIPFRAPAIPGDGAWRIGIMGRISPEKGQAEFIRAAALLHDRFPNAKFLVCGAPMFGDPAYFSQVQSLARGLPIEFLGWRDDVASVFVGLDLLAVPSKLEGMGRVVIEAFSAGVPVVAFPTGGIPELIADDENGFLTSDKSPESLASRIAGVLETDHHALCAVVANARRCWERSYTLAAYQKRITELMEKLTSPGRAAPETAAPLRRTEPTLQ
jgi:glycosyltransferase involved in cell wall biosynthesis